MIDHLFSYVISPLCLIGFILNIISHRIIVKITNERKKLPRSYFYLKVYLIDSAFMCFCGIFSFYTASSANIKNNSDQFSKFIRYK